MWCWGGSVLSDHPLDLNWHIPKGLGWDLGLLGLGRLREIITRVAAAADARAIAITFGRLCTPRLICSKVRGEVVEAQGRQFKHRG